MTYASLLSCSVLMSKFMQVPPNSSAGPLAGRSRVSLSGRPKPQSSTRRLVAALREGLDRPLVLRLQRTVRIELQIPTQRGELDLGVPGVLRGRRELRQVRRAPGMDPYGCLVRLDSGRRGGDRLLVQRGGLGRRRLRRACVGRVLTYRRSQRAAGQER